MLLVYTHKITPRLRYIFKQIFREFLEIEVGFTTAVEKFIAHQGAKISYSKKPLGNEMFFQCHNILFEQGVNDIDISVTNWDDIPIFFQTNEKSEFPFDIFGASFFLLSRYEEYLPHIRDEHNRFTATESLAFKNNFIKIPLVDLWVRKLYDHLKEKFVFKSNREFKFSFESTIDVNQLYKYKMKGLVRGVSGLIVDLSMLRITRVYDRLLSVFGFRKDPYDSFAFLTRVQKNNKIKMSYFFLLSNYSKYDRNISYHKAEYKALIKSVGDRSAIGLHPSYYSNMEPEKFKIEKERLESITNFRIKSSRQHFIKLQLPETYRYLIDNEIYNDSSMGYVDNIGYRASTSEPFYFYDIDFEIQTPLIIHPYVVSDYALKYELKLSTEEAFAEIVDLMKLSKTIGSTFTSLFHNDSLGRDEEWEGWRSLYLDMVKTANS